MKIVKQIAFHLQYLEKMYSIKGAAEKSNPLPYLVDIPTTNLNFYNKIYTAILQSYLHIIAKLYYIVTPFD